MGKDKRLLDIWLSLSQIQYCVNDQLERVLQQEFNLSLKEFYVLYFLSLAEGKQLRLQQLEEIVGLSQSAISRLVGRMEAKSCGALKRNSCELDRRGIYTQITAYGEEKLKKALEAFNKIIRSSFNKEQLYVKLEELIKNI